MDSQSPLPAEKYLLLAQLYTKHTTPLKVNVQMILLKACSCSGLTTPDRSTSAIYLGHIQTEGSNCTLACVYLHTCVCCRQATGYSRVKVPNEQAGL